MLGFHDVSSEAQCQDVLACIADGFIFADKEGVIRLWNPGAEAIFGFTAADAVGQGLDLIIPERLRPAHWNGYHRAISRGSTVHGRRSFITRSLHKFGYTLYVDLSFSIVKNRAGETIGSAAVARDATERYLEEKRLRRERGQE